MGRWQRYWFAEGGRTASAVVRIAIATAVLMTLWKLATLSTVQLPGPRALYRPVGMWMLLGRTPPPDAVIAALWGLAWAGTAAMLLGLFTRVATAVSFAAALALTSLAFASSVSWSHQYNVVFLAQMAFLGARGGDTLSIDALIRRWRGLPALDVPRGYQWSLRLVTLAVAVMFTGAAFHKLLQGHFTLRWALSDNLRHQLLVNYDLAGLPRPPLVDWLLEDVWRYRTAALMNLISQSAPILAVIFVRRPLIRAMAGGFFVLETVALSAVVQLWNPHWLPLVAVFIDWDRLIAFVRRRPAAAPPESTTPPNWAPRRAIRVFIIAFVIYDAIISVIPGLDQMLNTYPFSSFPMFSTVRARAPYDEHLPYTVPGDHFEALSDLPLDEHAQRWFDHNNRGLEQVRTADLLHRKLTSILAEGQRRFPQFGIHGVRHYVALFEAPPYPAPAHFERHLLAISGEIDRDGVFHSVFGSIDRKTGDVELHPENVDAHDVRLERYHAGSLVAEPLTVPRTGDRFAAKVVDGEPIYVVAVIGDQRWLAASWRPWRWD